LSPSFSQGVFTFWNPNAPTYIGVLGGAYAGPGIAGQALVGLTNSSLTPLELPREHGANGIVLNEIISVDFAPYYTFVDVQMAVWDGTLWGTNFSNVPTNQLGFTDIVPVEVVRGTDPFYYSPQFTQSAVVPNAPEPGVVSLAILGGLGFALACYRQKRKRRHKSGRSGQAP
jgi:hypothetical protein